MLNKLSPLIYVGFLQNVTLFNRDWHTLYIDCKNKRQDQNDPAFFEIYAK